MPFKLHFEWKIERKDGPNQGLFFQHQATFFDFQKGQGRPPHPLPIFTPVSVAEYASISFKMLKWTVLTMPKLWICMIILHVLQAFEDALGSKQAMFLNMARLCI